MTKFMKLYEFSTRRPEIRRLISMFTPVCKTKNAMYILCADTLTVLLGPNTPLLTERSSGHILRNWPASISLKQLVHFGQLIRSGNF